MWKASVVNYLNQLLTGLTAEIILGQTPDTIALKPTDLILRFKLVKVFAKSVQPPIHYERFNQSIFRSFELLILHYGCLFERKFVNVSTLYSTNGFKQNQIT